MESASCGRSAIARLCARVCMSVSPEASLGLCRAYPCGSPTICELDGDPCERCIAARYVIRQPFVAEIPVAIHSGVRACRPVIKPCGRERHIREGQL